MSEPGADAAPEEPAPASPPPSTTAPDPRPRPQYGEYATPAEVAAATGIPLPDTRGESESVSRLAQPIPVTPAAHEPRVRRQQPAPMRPAPTRPAPTRPAAAQHPARFSTLVTVLLLVFGIWNTVTAIPSFLDLGATLSDGLAMAGYGVVSFGSVAHVGGIVLLIFSFLVLIAAVGLSLRRIRDGRSSVWVPVAAAVVWAVGMFIGMIVVVANTPGFAAMIQNHS